ncbi:MAG: Uma2 family endonuclease [Dolichospermum sp. UKL201]|nr:MAG: Uma2 family endonuclease [Dolichospermum sp. UKL201]
MKYSLTFFWKKCSIIDFKFVFTKLSRVSDPRLLREVGDLFVHKPKRLWIPQRLIYIYPDVIIIADEPEFFNNRTDTITNPQVIIEVLSKSTKSYDREDKFAAYRTIPTFQEYLLIDQNRIHGEQFSKTGKKRWNLREYDEEDENISLETVSFEISLQDLYNKVKFPHIKSAVENSTS